MSTRVLVLGLNYPPEPTGISPYTGSMARGLVRRGLITRVLTAHPHYPNWKVTPGYGQWSRSEHLDEVPVRRLRHYVPGDPKGLKRVLSEISFGARLATARWGTPDVIVTVSPALISSAMGLARARWRRLLGHRAVTVVWVQDLYTLGLSETGQASGLVVRLMSALEGWMLRTADRVVVIHDRFAQRVSEDFGVPREHIEVVRNWTHLPPMPAVDIAATRARLGWSDDETVVLHAGNMGVKQGLDNVINAARAAADRGDRVRFVLLGAGSELGRLRAAGSALPTLQFLSPLNDADFAAALASADCLLVNERPGVSEMAVPSKLTSYFSAGRPVVAATDVTGITADEIRSADAGVVVPAGDPAALLDAVSMLSADADLSRRLGANGRQYRHTVLDEESAIDQFTTMLLRITPSGDGAPARVSDPQTIEVQENGARP
jgi:glycosyltransferase involved in cell wall biosynthesis